MGPTSKRFLGALFSHLEKYFAGRESRSECVQRGTIYCVGNLIFFQIVVSNISSTPCFSERIDILSTNFRVVHKTKEEFKKKDSKFRNIAGLFSKLENRGRFWEDEEGSQAHQNSQLIINMLKLCDAVLCLQHCMTSTAFNHSGAWKLELKNFLANLEK